MIPLYKLERLPRTQQLRKIAKVFAMADNRLCASNDKKGPEIFTAAELVFFTDAAKLLTADILFPADARKMFGEAAAIFEQMVQAAVRSSVNGLSDNRPDEAIYFHRALNDVKHLLLNETGRGQADWDFTAGDGRLEPAKRQIFEGMWVYFEDIRSPFNVGAMFRTAESFGVEKIILSTFCADPRHRRAQRTAMGCIDIVHWERQNLFAPEDPLQLSCPVFALETGGISINDFPFPDRGLLIAGSEELGVSPRALAAADASLGRVSIPCYGAKASLNVSVAFGIAMQRWGQVNAARKTVGV